MKKSISVLITLLLLSSFVSASWFTEMVNRDNIVTPNKLVDENIILEIANDDPRLQEYMGKLGVNTFTIKTEAREINLAYVNGKISHNRYRGQYTITTTEKDINELYNQYSAGLGITLKDVKSRVNIPVRLYLRVVKAWFI